LGGSLVKAIPMKKTEKKSSGKCFVPEQLVPVLRAKTDVTAGKKIKKRARGIPFIPGNRIGVETRFQKGVSANPGGRPKSAKYAEALRQLLTMDPTETIPTRTNAEKLAKQVFQLATTGKKKLGAICEIGDRAEGRPATTVAVNGSDGDPIVQLIADMHQIGLKLYGRPEGWMPPKEQKAITEMEKENEETEA
jgi:hypothetical protein